MLIDVKASCGFAVTMVITWTPKICNIMAFMAVIMGVGLLFYILLGFRYS